MSEYEADELIVASESAERYELESLRQEVEHLQSHRRRGRGRLTAEVATTGAFAGAVAMFCADAGASLFLTTGLVCMVAGVFGIIKIMNRDNR